MICAFFFRGKDHLVNFRGSESFVINVELMLPAIWGHMPAEGS